ncbi:MAG: glycoside hydrolase family 3 C-terminal domain-containing protein, partial [Blautia hydrogenotrophica]
NQLGDYTPAMRKGFGVTLLAGLREFLGKDAVSYAEGCPVCGDDATGIPAAVRLARESDLVILAVGGSSSRFAGARFDINGAAEVDGDVLMDCGEGIDCSMLQLPGQQECLCQAVLETGVPVVTVVIAGRPYAIPKLCQKSDAVLYAFYPGPWGGRALSEILLGKVSPSGRLPASLPRSVGQLPCYYNPKSSYRPMRYCDQEENALYPFGYGLSYTTFFLEKTAHCARISIEELRAGKRAEVTFRLKNTGKQDSYAVPQLFIRDLQASTVRRIRELKAFDKVFVKAGEEKICSLSLGEEELALWDADMAFRVEPGDFSISLEEGGQVFFTGILTVYLKSH